MSWEKRSNRQYYYRKRRLGNRVSSEYIGAGPKAIMVYESDLAARKQREQELINWVKVRSENQKIDTEVKLLNVSIMFLVRAVLLISNYHPHKGQWRRLRNGK